MGPGRRKSKRHQLVPTKRMAIKTRRFIDERQVAEVSSPDVVSKQGKYVDAKLVDISVGGLKLESLSPFEFQERIGLEIPRSGDRDPLQISAQVRWVQPSPNGQSWSVGCKLSESLPAEFVNELAQQGILDRRESTRVEIDEHGIGKWELSQEEVPVSILDVSKQGLGIVIPEEAAIGKRLRIKLTSESGLTTCLTVKAEWQQVHEHGYFVGCSVVEGSTTELVNKTDWERLVSGGSRKRQRTYEAFTFAGLSLILVLMIRHLFF